MNSQPNFDTPALIGSIENKLTNCHHCQHKPEDPHALYCSQCGQSLSTQNRCTQCGKPFWPEAHFCDHCGSADSEHPIAVDSSSPKTESLTGEVQNEAEITSASLQEQVQLHLAQVENEREEKQEVERQQQQKARLAVGEENWVSIPAGDYLMGSPAAEKNRFQSEQQHAVQVAAFDMLDTQVTFAMYDAYCEAMDISKPRDESWGRDNHPVINLDYWGAVGYCKWLSKQTGWHITLPTEAEWEYACRAGTTTPFWTGETITTEQANFDGNFTYAGSVKTNSRGKTTPVDQYPANPWGLHDMHGNVWEWCASEFSDEYTEEKLELSDASHDSTNTRPRVVRGGCWHNVPSGIRSACRNKLTPKYCYYRVGFRIVRRRADTT